MKKRSQWIYLATLFLFAVFLTGFFLWRGSGGGLEIRTERPIKTTEAPAAETAAQGKLDLNQATAEELEALPGVGPVLAERILAYRQEAGGFGSVEELLRVEGIGQARLEGLRDYVTVEEKP